MKSKLRGAMTAIIAVQAAIEIARFVGETYTAYKTRKRAKSQQEEEAETTPHTNDEVR